MKAFTIKNILLYAAATAAILLLLQWMQFSLLVIDHATEIYSTGIAVIFTFLGIWLTCPDENRSNKRNCSGGKKGRYSGRH